MAIQGTYMFNGVAVPDAQAVVTMAWVQSPTTLSFQVPVYANAEQRAAESWISLNNYGTVYDPTGGDVFTQCYAHLLTLPEYAGWTVTP